MEIKVCKTNDWTEKEWDSYVYGYNEVFGTSESVSFFKDKYLSVYKGYCLHSLLEDESSCVVGGVTVIPCRYSRAGGSFLNGLAVDVFIRPAYREDPLMLRRLYTKLKPLLVDEGVEGVTAVPNATAYPYWKNVVKWKDVGDINYWIVPARAGNVFDVKHFRGVLNALSLCYSYCSLWLSYLTSICQFKNRQYEFGIYRDDNYVKYKLDGHLYTVLKEDNISIAYRVVDEDGVRTGYVVDASIDGRRSACVFTKVARILLGENVDIIIYVGKMGIFQTLFIKVPKRFEPKRLPLMFDSFINDDEMMSVYNINEWDFGILNYDVR